MKFACAVLLGLVAGQGAVLAATSTDGGGDVALHHRPANVGNSNSGHNNARLAARQMTREKLVARQLGTRHGHVKRTGPSTIPVLPTVCGTLPGARFLLRATTPDTGSLYDMPASAPGYVSTRGPGNDGAILSVYFTTKLEFADTYHFDENNGCALIGDTRPGTVLGANPNSLGFFGDVALQGVESDLDDVGGNPYEPVRCAAVVGLVSCTVHDTSVSFMPQNYGNLPPGFFNMITIDPTQAYLSFDYVTLTLVPVD